MGTKQEIQDGIEYRINELHALYNDLIIQRRRDRDQGNKNAAVSTSLQIIEVLETMRDLLNASQA